MNEAGLIIFADLSDISKRLIAKKGHAIDFKLVHQLAEHGKKLKKTFVKFGETSLYRHFKNIFNEEKYFTIFTPYRTNDEIAGVVKNVEITKEIMEELRYIEEHLPYTFRHTLLVTALIVKMAFDLKTRDYDPKEAALAGLLHDLGKSRIPKHILGKDTPLTQSEYNFLKTHSLLSYLLLCYYLGGDHNDIYNTARDHHERLDGSGYPRGVERLGRYTHLITPVDIFDALISERPYRGSSFTIRQALDHIITEANEGKIDKEVVYYLISYVRKEHPRPEELTPYEKRYPLSRSDSTYGKVVPD
jgi:HD-GYP domain-containing protein (c-di-GMP phosphodiesterase class II)